MESFATDMTNPATMCQDFVGKVLEPLHDAFPDAYIIHSMDDILLAASSDGQLQQLYEEAQKVLPCAQLVIAPEKVQSTAPYEYLGHILDCTSVIPQKFSIRKKHLLIPNDF